MLNRLTGRLRRLRAVLRFTPFDTSTPEGRSDERYRRAALTAAAALSARVVQFASILVTVPLTLGYLGPERYGLWMTISSIVLIASFADLGLGLGLLSAISDANGRDDRDAARKGVSSAFFVLLGMAFTLSALFAAAYPWISWPAVYKVAEPRAVAECGPATAVFAACFLASIPLGVTARVQLGYQEGFTAGLWEAAGHALGLAAVVLSVRTEAGLPWLILSQAGAPVLASGINGLLLFGLRHPWLRPSTLAFSRDEAFRILRYGIQFFVLQVAATILFASDNIILTCVAGPESVTPYSVTFRLFNFVLVGLSLLLGSLWPAYGEAVARGDRVWIRKAFARSLLAAVCIGLVSTVILVAGGRTIIRYWTGGRVDPPMPLLIALGAWTVLNGLGLAIGTFLNGIRELRAQLVFAALLVPVALASKILGVMRDGPAGLVWGTFLSYAVCSAIPMCIVCRRYWLHLGSEKAPGGRGEPC